VPLKALIAEDNPGFRQILERMLTKWGYDVVTADSGLKAWQMLQATDPPRLALLDWMMPGLDGVEICRRVRELGREPYIYILLVTARDTPEELVEGMEAGADDYLRKPVNSHELRVRLRAGRRIIDLQEELVNAREALRRQATRDPLTGFGIAPLCSTSWRVSSSAPAANRARFQWSWPTSITSSPLTTGWDTLPATRCCASLPGG
jgi:DNA-binding response OmpR family regulator